MKGVDGGSQEPNLGEPFRLRKEVWIIVYMQWEATEEC